MNNIPYKNKYVIPAWNRGNELPPEYVSNGLDVVALVRTGEFTDKIATPVVGHIMILNEWDGHKVGLQVLDQWLPWDKVIAWRYLNRDVEFPDWHNQDLIRDNMIQNGEA